MTSAKQARITCDQCLAWYNSERELREHMQTLHRRFITELSPSDENRPEIKAQELQIKSKEK